MIDLFSWQDQYPLAPGYTDGTTSKAAARRLRPISQSLRNQVLIVYRAAWPNGLTAQEAAARAGKSEFSIRPRITELRKLGELFPVIDRDGRNHTRTNDSGCEATVLLCKRPT